jgi:predicted ATPase/class 3 adenylate cyclase
MVTTTFLFTDIVGSTRLWDAHPEAMKEALARHDEIITRCVESHGGSVFKNTGDGAASAFDSARSALLGASSIQQELAGVSFAEVGSLRARIGIHSGEAEERDGDYFGPPLNRAARLMSAGHGGQVLVSLVTARLAESGDLDLHDLGEHRLKDLSLSERIFQLVVDGQPSEFPPLRTLDASPNNLPTLTTSFVGREAELGELTELVAGARLVTVTGVGGTGKTRVALQVAAERAHHHLGGVWLVALGAVTDPAMVDGAVMETLGLEQPLDATPREVVIGYLASLDTLLVIDNCEHLVADVAALIAEILARAPDCTMIATSREPLGVPGEVVYGLRSMSLPHPDASAGDLIESDSVALFVERAVVAQPRFLLDEENAAAVAEICLRLDGMPLALELAAAKLRTFGPAKIAELLDQRFRLLTGGSRTALPRQQTLAATIDWSYRLLGETERLLFERLAAFQGGFTFEAVSAVCTDKTINELDVLELLPALVDRSLVVVDHDAGDRYRLLETLRQFARDRLDEHGGGDAVRQRHAEYFLGFVVEAQDHIVGPDEVAWRSRVRAEADNLRQAMTWAIGAGEGSTALEIAFAFSRFLRFEGRWSEPLRWVEEVLDAAPEPMSKIEEGIRLARHAHIVASSPETERAVSMLERAVEIFRDLDAGSAVDTFWFPGALLNLAVTLFRQGKAGEDNELFTELVQEALDVARRIGDRNLVALCLGNLAHHMDPEGDSDDARRLFKEAEEATRALGSETRMALITSQRAFFEFHAGDLEASQRAWRATIQHSERAELGREAAEGRLGLAMCELEMGDNTAGDRLIAAVRALMDDPEIRDSGSLHQTMLVARASLDAAAARFDRVAVAAGATSVIDGWGVAVRWDLADYFERSKEAARVAMGEETFAAGVAEGEAMTREEIDIFVIAG